MSYNGAGVFNLYSPGNPVVTGTTISSSWANNTLSDIATGLSTAITRDGQSVITANIPMGTYKFTGLGSGSASTDSVTLGQVATGLNGSGVSLQFTAAGTGAVARTWSSKARDIISVKDYGATGDGVTNDSSAIQAAITAAADNVLYFPPGTYIVSTALTSTSGIKIVGSGMRTTSLKWTGGASTVLTITSAADNCEISDMVFDNTGTATVALQINCPRSLVERCFAFPQVKFSTAVFSCYQSGSYSYYNAFKDCYLSSYSAAQTGPIGINVGGGNTVVIDNCMITGFATGIKQQNGGSTTLYGFSVVNSRIESFSGDSASYPGTHTAIGIDVGDVYGLNISGCNFEMDGDAQVSAAAQRAIKLGIVAGGSISGNHFSGNGQCTAAINVSSSSAKNVVIEGNNFYSMNGYGIEATGTGQLYNVEIGANNAPSPTTGVYNDSFTPTLTFGGGNTGITYTYQVGKWKRTGKWITAQANIQLSNKGSSSGAVRINAFPVASSATTGTESTGAVYLANMTGLGATQVTTIIATNSSQARLYRSDTGAELADTAFNNNSLVQVQHTYLMDI